MINFQVSPNRVLFGLMLCTSLNSTAQYVEEKDMRVTLEKENFISFNLGLSSPSGDYGDQSLSNYYAGLAKTGYTVDLGYAYFLNYSIGLYFKGINNGHPFNTEVILDNLIRNDPIPRHTVESGWYNTSSVMGGVIFTIPFENGYLDIKALVGYAYSSIPFIYITRDDGTTFNYVRQNASSANSISYDLGIGLRINLSDSWALRGAFDFYATNPEFDIRVDYDNGNSESFLYSQSMSMTNTTIGIVYRIKQF